MSTSFEPGARGAAGSIPLCVPEIRGREWEYVKECLDTGWVSSVGSYVDRFERQVAERLGAQHAVAVVNGTAALQIALLLAGVEPGDEVVTSALTFVAPANAVRYLGAWPVLIDAEPQFWQIDPQRVADFLERGCHWREGALHNRETGRRIRALAPVHILGHTVEMEPLLALAEKYGLPLIEDAAEALGARYRSRSAGTFGGAGCLSFNGNKLITTGGGGMLVTDNAAWARKARYLTTQAKDDPIEYEHEEIGYNYRLTNIQAALGCAQLEQLDEYVAKKRAIAAAYAEGLADVPGIRGMREAEGVFSSYWLYTILVDAEEYGMDSRALLRHLGARGIQTRPLWRPLHLNPPHADAPGGPRPVAEHLAKTALSLPCSVGLTEAEQQRVIDEIRQGAASARVRTLHE